MRHLNKPIGLVLIIALSACSPSEQSRQKTAMTDISEACSTLANKKIVEGIAIASSKAVSETENLPSFCQITGKIDPQIGFEARFPLTDWNGKYFQAGCGGFCGVVAPNRETHSNAINHALRRGYATITTDAGHEGLHIGDGRWALDNPAAEEIYAHKTLPLTLETGHQLIEIMYKDKPKYSYFSGCSNGGRMGAIAAQRYPELFDGIVSGCPVLNLSINGGAFGAWVLQAMTDTDGRKIINHEFAAKLPVLETNSLEQCDATDGVEDGIISVPFNCTVNLDSVPACSETSNNDCLTKAERTVIQKWYDGPINSAGKQIFPGMAPGSERYWGHWYLGTEKMPGPGTLLADGYGKYFGFPEDPQNYSSLDFNFDKDVSKLAEQGQLYDALNPDLTAFKEAGGKMIMWHGMSDPLVLPNQSPKYYEAVETEMGGQDSVQTFFRLFMAPGLGHCWDKPANTPDQMDMLGALEAWVEHGNAPDIIEVTKYYEATGNIERKGKLRPYPLTATYGPLHP